MFRSHLYSFAIALTVLTIQSATAQDIRKKAYMEIAFIEVSSSGRNERTIYASDVSVLEFILHYDGLKSSATDVHLLYKLIRPNGEMVLLTDMDAYSGEVDFTVQPKKDRTAILASIPATSIGTLRPGRYTFELWYEGRILHTTPFDLAKKPDEATFLNIDRTEYTLSGEGETVNFLVETDADRWYVRVYPSWCSILSQEGKSLRIKALPNQSSFTRFDVVLVEAGDCNADIQLYQPVAENELMDGEWREAINASMESDAIEFEQGFYKGGWSNGPDGFGIYSDKNGIIYAGEWKDGMRKGYGLYMGPFESSPYFQEDCSYFSGYWSDNLPDGVCVGFDELGNPLFAGGYSQGVRDRQMDEDLEGYEGLRFESIKKGNDQFYVGETTGGVPEGFGVLLYPNRDIWCGVWKNGKQSEDGILIPNGQNVSITQLKDESSSETETVTKTAKNKRNAGKKTKPESVSSEYLDANNSLDSMPSFNGGGTQAFTEWVSSQLEYPLDAQENHISGTVKVAFNVDEKGRVNNVVVIEGLYPSLDAEAVRVIKTSPPWEPGYLKGKKGKKGKPISVNLVIPVVFPDIWIDYIDIP